MPFDVIAAAMALVAGLVLFFWGTAQLRAQREGPRPHLMMWGGVVVILVGGFASATQLGFLMVIGAFALIGQGLAEFVRWRRERNRRKPRQPWR